MKRSFEIGKITRNAMTNMFKEKAKNYLEPKPAFMQT